MNSHNVERATYDALRKALDHLADQEGHASGAYAAVWRELVRRCPNVYNEEARKLQQACGA